MSGSISVATALFPWVDVGKDVTKSVQIVNICRGGVLISIKVPRGPWLLGFAALHTGQLDTQILVCFCKRGIKICCLKYSYVHFVPTCALSLCAILNKSGRSFCGIQILSSVSESRKNKSLELWSILNVSSVMVFFDDKDSAIVREILL